MRLTRYLLYVTMKIQYEALHIYILHITTILFLEDWRSIGLASYNDIARITGLSLGTISNVIQGKKSVKDSSREKVEEAVRQLGYRINYQARSLAAERGNLIGLVVSTTENIAESSILFPMENFAEKHGSRVIWATSRNNKERERTNCEAMLSSKVDCLFVFLQSLENEAYFRHLAETEKTPVILLARYIDGINMPYAAVDNWYAAQKMVEYIYKMGHRELTYLDIAEESMLSPNRDRRKGVIRECEKMGINCKVIRYPVGKNDCEVGYQAAEEMIKDGTLPSLVFPRDDSFAVGFYSACMRYQIRIPEDVSIMSFGKFYSDYMTPKRLSTFDRKFDKVIETAANLFLQISEAEREGGDGEEIQKKIFIKGCLVEGETVADLSKVKN